MKDETLYYLTPDMKRACLALAPFKQQDDSGAIKSHSGGRIEENSADQSKIELKRSRIDNMRLSPSRQHTPLYIF